MRFGELPKRFSRLRLKRFPAFAATEGRLRTKTNDPSASLREAERHGLAAPTEVGFGQERIALTIFQRHLGLKGAPFGSSHFGRRQA
jgi:hypothetical protein